MNINKKDLTSEIKKVVDLINKRFLNEALTEIENYQNPTKTIQKYLICLALYNLNLINVIIQ